jgi:hypothetical protein
MSRIITKEKLNSSVQVNFNASREVAYWSKKYNISQDILQRIFEESGYSISKTINYCMEHALQRA